MGKQTFNAISTSLQTSTDTLPMHVQSRRTIGFTRNDVALLGSQAMTSLYWVHM